MFGYLKVFIMVSLIAVIIIAMVVGFYLKSSTTSSIFDIASRQNALVATGYVEAVWKKTPYPGGIMRLRRPDETKIREQRFVDATKQYLSSIGIDRFSIYSRNASRIFAQHTSDGNIRMITEKIALLQSSAEQSTSWMDMDGQALTDPDSGSSEGTPVIVKTLSAIGPSNQYYIATHHDISRAYWQATLTQWVTSGSIIIIFLLLMWILIQTSKKAEKIIVEQHESNTELATKAAVAESENKQKSMFLANISHELRTPLNAIIGFSQIIQQDQQKGIDPEKLANYVNDIHNSGVHLLSLINDILDFSKAEAGKLEITAEELNLSKLVKSCLRLVSPRAEKEGIILIDATPKEALVLMADSKKLKQVLLNLFSNSVKFTPSKGEIRVSAWRNIQDDTISFEVKDNGIGMAPKDISRAISPFGQIDSTLSRKYEGTGLGLPLTKKIIELMGGSLKIESELDVGTSITVTLPIEYRLAGLEAELEI